MAQGNCGKMYKSRILSDKTGADCAEMFLDIIQQQRYMTPPQYSNPRQLFVWNKEKGKTLLIHVNCRSICIFISLHNEDLKKIIQILFFSTATNESKDGFDIDEISPNKRFFPEIIIPAGNIMKNRTISIVYYSQIRTLV